MALQQYPFHAALDGQPSPREQDTRRSRLFVSGNLGRYLCEDIAGDMFIQLLLMAFIAGTLDISSWHQYGLYVSRPAPNTALALLATLHVHVLEPGFRHNIALCTIIFVFGITSFTAIGRIIGPHRRIWLFLSTMVQAILILAAALISRTRSPHDTQKTSASSALLIILLLLSLSAASHISSAFTIAHPWKFSRSSTPRALLCLATDPLLFPTPDFDIKVLDVRIPFTDPIVPVHRSFVFVMATFHGGLAAAPLLPAVDVSVVWFVIAAIKAVVALSFLSNMGAERRNQDLLESAEKGEDSLGVDALLAV